MSRDPEAGYPQLPITLHKYLYAGENPVNQIDPLGREAVFEDVFVTAKALSRGVLFGNTVSCSLNIVLLGINDELGTTLAGEQGGLAAGLGWGGAAATTHGCITVAWNPTGTLATLNTAAGAIGCGIALAQMLYDLHEYVIDPTPKNEKNFLLDWTGGTVGCAVFLVAL